MPSQVIVSRTDNRAQAIRKTTVAFASLFKDIPFVKYDDVTGAELEHFKVPIIYSNKEKYVKRLDIANEKVQITLPRIEYGLLNLQYDAGRRTNQANKITGCSGNGTQYVNSPLPYNFNFELTLYTRNIEDANQIMEYIMQFFYPDYNLRINMIPALGITKNVPITFNGESEDEDSTGSYDSPVRSVFRTLSFTARSYIYQPVKLYKPILWANTNIFILQDTTKLYLTTGNGSFMIGETVFVGETFNRPTAKGTVTGWNQQNKTLELTPFFGAFVANSTIKTAGATTQYTIGSISGSGLAYNSNTIPVPDTYPPIGPYDYNITLHDYTA